MISNWGEAIKVYGAAKPARKVELEQVPGQLTIDDEFDEAERESERFWEDHWARLDARDEADCG